MAPTERSPLLEQENEEDQLNETSPLLSNEVDDTTNVHQEDQPATHPQPTTERGSKRWRRCRWPSIIAIFVLAICVVAVIILGFIVPPAVKKYAENAAVLEPTGLFVESITPDGVRARITANFRLDGSRVTDRTARRIGKVATSIMRKLETEETKVDVFAPHYGNARLGSAVVPPISLSLVDGHNTDMDFVTDLNPGSGDSLRVIVNDWLDGKLDQLKVTGKTALRLKSGIFPLGTHDVVESMVFEGQSLYKSFASLYFGEKTILTKQVPKLPEYEIKKLAFHDVPLDNGESMGIGANITIKLHNDYSVGFSVPAVGVEVFVPDCDASKPLIKVASAVSKVIDVKPDADVLADAEGLIQDLPDSLTRACPNTKLSPLDQFVKHYLRGEDAKVYVKGDSKSSNLPTWLGDIVDSFTVPIDFPGQSFDNFIRNFSLTDVDFKLPSPFANPDDPDSNPRVSGTVEVLASLPDGMNVNIGVNKLRANGDLLYQGKKFGELQLQKWQASKSTMVTDEGDGRDLLKVTSRVIDAPIEITDSDIFADLMRKMLFGDDDLLLDVNAFVDVKVNTVLGNITLNGVPAHGKIPVKRVPGNLLTAIKPRIADILIVNTTQTGINLRAKINFTNPTPYTAYIPVLNVKIYSGEHFVGEASLKGLDMHLGSIERASVEAIWDPYQFGGKASRLAGQRVLSGYLSGRNTTMTVQCHRDSIPGMPLVGDALSGINLTFPVPRMKLPGGDDDNNDGADQSHSFIREAIFHIFTSAATFTLASPLKHNTVHIERIDATAYYNHTEAIGYILHETEFAAPPGLSQTPHLPVDWDLESVGYDKMREALGGSLRLDAVANVTVRLGNWSEEILYEGQGIGAKVRL